MKHPGGIGVVTWLAVALCFTATLSFWAGMRVERKRQELERGMAATLDDIDRERTDREDEGGSGGGVP